MKVNKIQFADFEPSKDEIALAASRSPVEIETPTGGMRPLNVVSVSGGKDSTALYLWAIDKFGNNGFRAVFADTGHEHPVTYNYLRNLPEMSKGPAITWVKADYEQRLKSRGKETSNNPFLDMMVWKGRAPSTKAQFCTEQLKLQPIRTWLDAHRGDEDVQMFVGIRAGESEKRSKMSATEDSKFFDCIVNRPLLKWTETEVFAFLEAKGIPPNPLYASGFSRVGCFPCIHARKSELARLPDWAWSKLAEWERTVGRSFFSPGTVPGIFIPTVEDVRQWSVTTRGGKQFDMFPPDSKDIPSCMATWGACE